MSVQPNVDSILDVLDKFSYPFRRTEISKDKSVLAKELLRIIKGAKDDLTSDIKPHTYRRIYTQPYLPPEIRDVASGIGYGYVTRKDAKARLEQVYEQYFNAFKMRQLI